MRAAASMRRAFAFLCLLLPRVSNAQSATIDWSTVEVDAFGETTFGPTVEVPEEEPQPHLSDVTGFFANADGFYGRLGHIEYLHVRRGTDGDERVEAMKLLGDRNVPRGRLTWRAARGTADEPRWNMSIQLQLRDDVDNENGYWWSPPDYHHVEWQRDFQAFHIVGQNPAGLLRARFHRVSHSEALEAAARTADAA